MRLNYTSVADPTFSDPEETRVNCLVTFEEYGDAIIKLSVSNIVEPDWPHCQEIWQKCMDGDYGPIAPYVEPALPVPSFISDRQFFQQMAIEGTITEEEAILAVSVGAIPAPLQAIVDSLPSEQRFGARMLLMGATEIERAHPMTDAVGYATGRTPQQIDDFFRAAILL